MRNLKQILPVLILPVLIFAPFQVMAETKAAPTDACTLNPTGNCESTKENFKFYMDVHRRGGGGNDSNLFKTFWEGTVSPGFQRILSTVSANIVNQGASQATFLEGQDHIRAVSALQQGSAQSARNYLPSESLCRFGTLSQSLATDDADVRTAQIAIATVGLKRDIGALGSASQAGAAGDMSARMDRFVKGNCKDTQGNLNLLCPSDSKRDFPDQEKDTRYNRDINYTRTIDIDQTLDANFVNTSELRPAVQDVMSLSQNLYGHKQVSGRLTEKQINTTAGQNVNRMTRSVSGARSVAQNTYAAIAAMKSQGSGSSRPYMKAILTKLGIADDKIDAALSEKPSYYAQMDILTKKLYQSPSFYVNLMEGKTNVARQSGAMEGLELMQDRDIYNSMRRSEMLLALMIQLQTRKELNDVVEGGK